MRGTCSRPGRRANSSSARWGEYLVSLPFDLKLLQEAVADPELPRELRELAATVLINALGPQDGWPGAIWTT